MALRKHYASIAAGFAKNGKEQTGAHSGEWIFDSRLLRHANLNKLNELGTDSIDSIALRRRGTKLLERFRQQPAIAWR